MRILALLILSSCAVAEKAARELTLTVAPFEKDRRWVLVEAPAKMEAPFHAVDAQGQALAAQADGATVRILVPHIPANEKAKLTLKSGAGKATPMSVTEDAAGFLSVKGSGREITRYHTGTLAEKHKKPFLYPLTAHGANVLRGYPMEDRPGDAKDHPHHSGLYFAFGEVNGKEYWSKLPITPKKVVKKDAGPACARIVAENAWGEELVETQEITILNAGDDAVIDYKITLTAANGPVTLGKDLKMAKEGAFAVRVGPGLSAAKGDAPEMITDSKGGKGEKAARASAAPWIHYAGEADGKKVGVAVMNHPSSFRYPGDWHVRAYGLFAANPWIIKGENTLQKGESLTLGYRVYVHAGDFAAGKVDEVFAGYANAKATAE